ncbi:MULTISPECIES: bifunctional hydroxymethylpyrimidine kinase/phosphomethylpyrimidine kinase [Campylobacter]|uniref:bifunctional hydroxymethylpyrimidine kinase/phosphomethylpyrimidine kinase n=1 Tax=Campylobacter TaxID=194 RepID=UPI00147652AD|nr:hydroxymethylpyrimidine/phosphomethylpyrimidine kinase [Campylobacter sp. RM12916]MBE3021544.1 hydroxymethylpyrimidine/phosphomethylpyrimidine kinase [Campylobacter sp. 7477a]MBE3609771.1 hydroxymethylpyrimidine/phosphomethylpyrimidine kinase [Campylobacter sp. RM12916]
MKNILIIAGSDSVGGAGAQADIKTCEAFGCYSATAMTVFVCENTQVTYDISGISANFVDSQIRGITEELEIDAIKVGMLFNKDVIQVVKNWLPKFNVPIVIDPVCISKSNVKLIEDEAISALKELLSFATIATPNRYEARELFNNDFTNIPCDVIVKKQVVDDKSVDTLYRKDGSSQNFATPLADPLIMHGAGCTFSTAIACSLAQGLSLEESIAKAKNYVYQAIQNGLTTKLGKNLLNHKIKI